MLGDVVREQAGEETFELVERVRQLSLAVYRDGADDAELVALLAALDVEQALHVVRAFSYFSLLANLAEDVQSERRWRAHRMAGSGPQPGSLAAGARPAAAPTASAATRSPRCSAASGRQPGAHRPPDGGRAAHGAGHQAGDHRTARASATAR